MIEFIDYDIIKGWLICQYITANQHSSLSTGKMEDSKNTIKQMESDTLISKHQTEKPIESISWTSFLLLTGKQIDLVKRVGKKIRVIRRSGHVYVSDHEWIPGENYKQDKIEVICCHVTKDLALLSKKGSMKVITSNKPLDWVLA